MNSADCSTPATCTRSRAPSSMQCFAVATSHGNSTTAPVQCDGRTRTVAAASVFRTAAGTGGGFAWTAVPTSIRTTHPDLRTHAPGGEPFSQVRRRALAELGVQAEDLHRLAERASRFGQRVLLEERTHLAGVAQLAERRRRLDEPGEHEGRHALTKRGPLLGHERPRRSLARRIAEESHQDERDV